MRGQAVLTVSDLPESALDAAARFHRDYVNHVRLLAEGSVADVAVVLPAAPYDHADWRRAAAHDLARALAPVRVNLVAGSDQAAIAATLAYLTNAPGVTGHYLALHGD
jgi:hypothetical protein